MKREHLESLEDWMDRYDETVRQEFNHYYIELAAFERLVEQYQINNGFSGYQLEQLSCFTNERVVDKLNKWLDIEVEYNQDMEELLR